MKGVADGTTDGITDGLSLGVMVGGKVLGDMVIVALGVEDGFTVGDNTG